ncbi:unnamed protein product [Pleuronectes platessa]|uniref:Uncharacterized protein n=1 Tax=Pleuronectes platessa TaxID=8262 RepID=A0A9N7Y8Y7_PLEPL|nr:unnamed protein product [Pleuronectes platessa]
MREHSQALLFATKIFSCLTTGRPAQHVALVTKTPLFQQEPPSSPRRTQRTTEGAFQDEAAKWLPLSKGRRRTRLTDSCVSCEIARHLERPDRKKGRGAGGGR